MSRAVRFRRESQSNFSKRFSTLCPSKGTWEVWSDFITISAVAIANAIDRQGQTHDDREREYLRLIGRYTPQERDGLAELFAMMVNALEAEPEQDFLGEMFMAYDLGSHWHEQFFTPYHISEFMARATMSDAGSHIEERGWIGISDPCCGAGALLIGARNELVRQGHGYNEALFVAQDLERTAALMCYIQLSLLGCAGYVVVGNSLTEPTVSPTGSPLLITPAQGQEIWIMPATCLGMWPSRIQCEWFKLALASLGCMGEAKQSPTEPKEVVSIPAPAPELKEAAGGQLTLF